MKYFFDSKVNFKGFLEEKEGSLKMKFREHGRAILHSKLRKLKDMDKDEVRTTMDYLATKFLKDFFVKKIEKPKLHQRKYRPVVKKRKET